MKRWQQYQTHMVRLKDLRDSGKLDQQAFAAMSRTEIELRIGVDELAAKLDLSIDGLLALNGALVCRSHHRHTPTATRYGTKRNGQSYVVEQCANCQTTKRGYVQVNDPTARITSPEYKRSDNYDRTFQNGSLKPSEFTAAEKYLNLIDEINEMEGPKLSSINGGRRSVG